MSKLTKGDWKVADPDPGDPTAEMRIVDEDGQFIGSAASAYYDRETCEANAKCMAAAKQMRRALAKINRRRELGQSIRVGDMDAVADALAAADPEPQREDLSPEKPAQNDWELGR